MTHTERFTTRARDYVTGRPTYPAALGLALRSRGLLDWPCADVGAGTGLFTRLLLEAGANVEAVEPNAAMRAELEHDLEAERAAGRLRVHAGSAEASGLADASVGLVSCAQSVHWFEPAPTVAEFRRILRPGGSLLLVRNDARGSDDPLTRQLYQGIHGGGDGTDRRRITPDLLRAYFGDAPVEAWTFPNPLSFSRKRLHALLSSHSGAPVRGTPEFAGATAALDRLFDEHQEHGLVTLEYRTHAYVGRL